MSATIATAFAGHGTSSPSGSSTLRAKADNGRRRTDKLHFQAIVWATLPAFLVAALVARSRSGRRPGDGRSKPSIFREAKAAARTCGSLALMG